MQGELELAAKLYQKKNVSLSSEEDEITSLRAIECYEKLGRWDIVSNSIESTVENDFSSLWEEDLRDLCMGKFIRSNVNISLEKKHPTSQLTSFIADSFQDEDRKKALILSHANDLAVTSLLRKDIGEASFYIKKAFESFSDFWISSQDQSSRRKSSLLDGLTKVSR